MHRFIDVPGAGRYLLLATALAALALLTGCAVGPDYHQPKVDLPTKWNADQESQNKQLKDLKKWWSSLGDPVLDQLVDEAVRGNLDVASAQAKIREARAAYRQAGGALMPSVEGDVAATKTGYGKKSASASSGKAAYYQTYEAGFDASWELDLFGGNRRAREAAGYALDASREDLRSTLLTLVGDVALYYVQAREYQAEIALARRTLVSQRQTAALTHMKFKIGSSSAVDMSSADADVATTEANIPDYEASYAEAVHRLSILLGRPPAALLPLMDKPAPVPTPTRALPAGVPAQILLNRPDVRETERELAQYTAQIGEAEAQLYPSISLTGSISTSAFHLKNMGQSTSIGWAIGPSLNIPIFNGGQIRAEVDIAKAQRDEQYFTYKASVLSALEDVENATVSFARSKDKAKSLDLAVRNYRKAANLYRLLYKSGESDILDVLTAERSLYSAEDSLVQSRAAITQNYIALAKALGGGWDKAMDSGQPLHFDDQGNLAPVKKVAQKTDK